MRTEDHEIPREEWDAFLDRFTDEHRGRLMRISLSGEGMEEEVVRDSVPFLSASFDPHHEGVLSIAAGRDLILYEHPVRDAAALRVREDALEILDEEGNRVMITFEA
jgi:hypothetical protein